MGQLVFQAALGGQVNLVGPNTASTFNLNVPAATDTLVGEATTNTLTNKTLAGPTITGNLGFTGTGNRITGDFSNATIANRVAFQNSTTNASTSIGILPNGTSTTALTTSFNNSDPTNAAGMQIACLAAESRINSLITGTGTYVPMTFYTGGLERMRIDTSGNLLVGGTTVRDQAKITVDTSLNGISLYVIPNLNACDFAVFRANSGTLCGNISRIGTTAAVNYSATSDYRLKNVVGSVAGHGERIDALKPIHYKWKDGDESASGFLAHEFQEVYANSVTGTKDKIDADGKPVYQGMQASSAEVIADLVAEIQSLRKRLTALEQA